MRYLLIHCIDETVELSPADDSDVEGSAAARAEQAWVTESAAPQLVAVIAAASALGSRKPGIVAHWAPAWVGPLRRIRQRQVLTARAGWAPGRGCAEFPITP
jgi:hypothetical protein